MSVERSLQYDYDDYYLPNGQPNPNVPRKLTTTATWPGANPTTTSPLTAKIPYNQLHTSLAQNQPFPGIFPNAGLAADLTAKGEARTIPSPDCYHATLSHRRIMVKLGAPATALREFKAILLTERTIDGVEQTPTSQILTLTIPQGQTQTSPLDLTPQFTGSGTGSQGYSESLLQSVIPIQILNAAKKEAAELKVAKMEHSLDAMGKLTIDDDPDRFFVRIKRNDTMKNVSIKLATAGNPEATYNDDPTQIDLVQDGDWFISKSLLLVSDDTDDDYFRNGVGKDDEKNDRTHKIQLGGNVRVESIIIDGEEHVAGFSASVPVKQIIQGRIVVVGSSQTSVLQINDFKKVAIERYAQLGIKFDLNITLMDVPEGVDENEVRAYGGAGGSGGAGGNLVHDDAKKLFDKAAAEGKTGTVTVFFVKNMEDLSGGRSFTKRATAPQDHPYANTAFLSLDDILNVNKVFNFVLAHEVGHIVTNNFHYGAEYGGNPAEHLIMHNLMRDGTSSGNHIRGSKRFYELQQNDLFEEVLHD